MYRVKQTLPKASQRKKSLESLGYSKKLFEVWLQLVKELSNTVVDGLQ